MCTKHTWFTRTLAITTQEQTTAPINHISVEWSHQGLQITPSMYNEISNVWRVMANNVTFRNPPCTVKFLRYLVQEKKTKMKNVSKKSKLTMCVNHFGSDYTTWGFLHDPSYLLFQCLMWALRGEREIINDVMKNLQIC